MGVAPALRFVNGWKKVGAALVFDPKLAPEIVTTPLLKDAEVTVGAPACGGGGRGGGGAGGAGTGGVGVLGVLGASPLPPHAAKVAAKHTKLNH